MVGAAVLVTGSLLRVFLWVSLAADIDWNPEGRGRGVPRAKHRG